MINKEKNNKEDAKKGEYGEWTIFLRAKSIIEATDDLAEGRYLSY